MAVLDELEGGIIGPGVEISFTNSPIEAQTIFCDGLKGVVMQGHVTKISFFEQVLDPLQPGQLFARFVANLVIPNDQFIAIAELLKRMADEAPGQVAAARAALAKAAAETEE